MCAGILAASEEKVQLKADVASGAARLDALVLAGLSAAHQKPNADATDEQFVRRVYLDVAGRVPTAHETLTFLADTSSERRAKLIDRLIGSDGYNSQMFNWLADTLRIKDVVGKRGQTYVYQEWLKDQIGRDRSWDDTVFKMLTATGRLGASGPAGYLLRDPGMPLDNLSNTLTVFLGANVACAQCHDHPLAPWTQKDFYQMAAFFGGVETHGVKSKKLVKQVIKKSEEFDEKDKRFLRQLIEVNAAEVKDIPGKSLKFPDDYQYKDAKPGDTVQPNLIRWAPEDATNPAYAVDTSNPETLRRSFAKWLTHSENPRFAAAIANRLWKKAFGIAVSEPVTDLDDLSKSANPGLLNGLAAEMKRAKFSLRDFQRILFNTKAYQRQASITPDLAKGPYLFPGPVLRRMSAEQAWDSVLTLGAGDSLDHYKLHRADNLKQFVIPEKELTVKAAEAAAKRAAANGGANRMNLKANLEMDGGGAPPPQLKGFIIARASELEQPARESHFIRMFGQSDRNVADDSSLEGGVPQVLMQMNGDVQKVIASKESQVMKAAERKKTPDAQIESLYVSFFSRRPTPAQTAAARKALENGLQLSEMTWVLFNTREFLFIQ